MIVVVLIVLLVINFIGASYMKDAAYAKGYDDSAHAFATCFWLGIIGYLYVIALPDIEARRKQDAIIELLSQNAVEEKPIVPVFENEDLPPL